MIIRRANMNDLDRLIEIEQTAFPPTEAATRESYAYRIEHFGSWFLLAEDEWGIKGLACCRPVNTEEMDDDMYEPEPMEEGSIISLLSIATDLAYRRQGIGGLLLEAMKEQAKAEKRTAVILACKAAKVHYYAKFGFVDNGPSKSEHGGVPWVDMIYRVK